MGTTHSKFALLIERVTKSFRETGQEDKLLKLQIGFSEDETRTQELDAQLAEIRAKLSTLSGKTVDVDEEKSLALQSIYTSIKEAIIIAEGFESQSKERFLQAEELANKLAAKKRWPWR